MKWLAQAQLRAAHRASAGKQISTVPTRLIAELGVEIGLCQQACPHWNQGHEDQELPRLLGPSIGWCRGLRIVHSFDPHSAANKMPSGGGNRNKQAKAEVAGMAQG